MLLQLPIMRYSFLFLDSLAVAGFLLTRVFIPPQFVINELAGIVDISFDDPSLRAAVLQVVERDEKPGSEGGSEDELEHRIRVEDKERFCAVGEMKLLQITTKTRENKNGGDEAGKLVFLHVVGVLCG